MAQRHSGLSERSNLVVSVSTEVETGTTSSPPQKIKVVVCFIKIPPLRARFLRSMRGGVTTLLVDQPEHKTQGGSVIAERAGLIKLSCSGEKTWVALIRANVATNQGVGTDKTEV